MFDINKRVECKDLTVGQLKKILETVSDDAKVFVLGDNYAYIHFEEDGSVISFDDNSLDDEYFKDDNNS